MYFSAAPSSGAGTYTMLTSSRPLTLVLQSEERKDPPKAIYNKSGQLLQPCLKRGVKQRTKPRFVYFGADLEHIRLFSKSEPPINAAKDASAMESKPSFSEPPAAARFIPIRKPMPKFSCFEESAVVLEAVDYANNSLHGTIKVHNLAFKKDIFVRMTTDGWKTFEDVSAVFQRSISSVDGNRPGLDRFSFSVPLADAETTMHISLCACYRVNGHEFWDNNQGSNYLFKLVAPTEAAPAATGVSKPSTAISDCDSIELCTEPTHSFASSTFQTLTTKHTSAVPPISRTDACRYMVYSEAKFSTVPASNHAAYASLSLFHAPQWPGYHTDSANTGYRVPSPLRASSPSACAGSPLAMSHGWASYSHTLLHC
ncbi:hypothetical protein EV183_005291 [Coemansia sp. RSA 2336]|nr:hypothetical protein EV183_005291 [Coemansia sp. RSA 2336]